MTATANLIEQLMAQAGWARRLARSLMRDDGDAEDVVQDTWVSALRGRPSTEQPLRGWLATVLRHHAFGRSIADRRRQAREAEVEALRDSPVSPEDLVARMEVQRALSEIVSSLAEPYRQTVLLRYFEGHSAAEIARLLDVPAGTVRWRLKTGLDQIRESLDRRHAGDRRFWLAALGPLAGKESLAQRGSGAAPVWSLKALMASRAGVLGTAGFLLVGAVVAVSLQLWGRPARGPAESGALLGRGERATQAGTGGTPIVPPGRASPPDRSAMVMAAAVAAPDLGSCRVEVQRLRAEMEVLEPKAMKAVRAETLFERGEPSPAAEAELGPIIARIMKSDRPAVPSYTLDCRTWVCRMTVILTEEEAKPERVNAWMHPLQRDPEMMARKRGASFRDNGRPRDPLSGAVFHRQVIYISLGHASGRPVAEKDSFKPNFGPLPSAAEDCRKEMSDLRKRMTQARADISKSSNPFDRFAEEPQNAALTAEMAGILGRLAISDPKLAGVKAECRGLMCKLTGMGPGDGLRSKIRLDPSLRGRIFGEGSMGDSALIILKSPSAIAGEKWLRGLVRTFEASPEVELCRADHPTKGVLRVRVQLQDQELAPGDRRPTAEFDDSLSGTPFARCVKRALETTALSEIAPDRTGPASAFLKLGVPRPIDDKTLNPEARGPYDGYGAKDSVTSDPNAILPR